MTHLAASTKDGANTLAKTLASSAKSFAYDGLTQGAGTHGTTLGASLEKAAINHGLLTAGGLTIGAAVRAALKTLKSDQVPPCRASAHCVGCALR